MYPFYTTLVTLSTGFLWFRVHCVCFIPIGPVQIERFGNLAITDFLAIFGEPLLNGAPAHAVVVAGKYRFSWRRRADLFRQELPVLIDMHGATELVAAIRVAVQDIALRSIDHVLLEERTCTYSLINSERRSRC